MHRCNAGMGTAEIINREARVGSPLGKIEAEEAPCRSSGVGLAGTSLIHIMPHKQVVL
jgi:hypothetical protein